MRLKSAVFLIAVLGIPTFLCAQTGISAGPGVSISISGGGSGCGVGAPCTVAAGGTGATTAPSALSALSGASLVSTTLQTFLSPLSAPSIVASTTNGIYTPAPGTDLQTVITTAGANSTINLSCGTYIAAGALTISAANVHLHGAGRWCTIVLFASTSGLSASGLSPRIDGITFEGLTGSYTVQFTSTADTFVFEDNAITQAGQGASTFPQAALWVLAGNTDGVVKDNLFYGNGPTSGQPAGYTVLTDGQTSGYVTNLHFVHNKIYSNNNGIAAALFDCYGCVIDSPEIDQNNADFTAAEGTGYGLMLYSMGYNTGTTSLARVSNTVTLVVPVMPSTWAPTVGETMMVSGYGFGGNGTSFNGIVTLASVTGSGTGPYTITWAQTAPDDTVTGGALSPGTIQPPVQHVVISNPHITDTAGSCLYLQGVSDITITGGELSQCDLSITPVSLPHSGLGVAGLIGGTITGMHVDTVGHSSAFSLNHTYGLAFGTNEGKNANKNGLTLFDNYNLSATGNVLRNNVNGGIVGTSTTGINCYKCSFSGNDLWLSPGVSGYFFQGLDQYINVSGGSVHAAATGSGNAGASTGTSTSNITFQNLEVNCYADGSTVQTLNYGIRSMGSEVVIKNNPIKGCAVAGVFEGGTNDTVEHNKISSSATGILATTATSPTIQGNTLFGNTATMNTSGATTPVISGNMTASGTAPPLVANVLTLTGAGCGAGTFAKADGTGCGNSGVTSINSNTGAFTFSGSGVSCTSTTCTFSGGAGGVLSINATTGAFTFTGAGVSCVGTTCTFSGAGSGVTSINSATGAFTFTGSGVSCTSTTCTFSGGAFSSLTGGTNTTAAMVVGSGASLSFSGTGTVNANQIAGGTAFTGNQGNGAKVQHSTGTTATGDCAEFDANGNVVDAGSGCGTGGVAPVSVTVPSFAIPSNTCYGSTGSTTPATFTMTGITTAMGITPDFISNPASVVGWGASGGLGIKVYSSATNTGSYVICNPTSGTITGDSITFLMSSSNGGSSGGSGSVSIVSSGNLAPLFTTSVSNATTTPAISYTLSNAAQNTVLAGPTSGSGVPSYRALVGGDLPAQYRIRNCSVGLGDGVNAIPAGTYPIKGQCRNLYGVTYTITGVQCFSDNSGTSTGNVADSAANTLLTGPITATSSWANGTQSGTTTLGTNVWANWTIVADGASKQIQCTMTGTI